MVFNVNIAYHVVRADGQKFKDDAIKIIPYFVDFNKTTILQLAYDQKLCAHLIVNLPVL